MRLGKFFSGNGRESAAPGAASGGPGRRAVEFCWAIRRPSTRTMRTRIAARSPKDAVAVPSLAATAACLATWAGGLLFGVDGVAGLRFRHAGGCLPRPRDRLGRRDSPGFDQGPWFVPSCPVNPERFQEAAALPRPDVTYGRSRRGPAHPSRFAPAASNAATWRIRADGVHLPMRSATLGRGSRGTWASPAASYGCRARAGLPPAVCRPVCRASPPDNVAAGPQMDGVRLHPAPRRHQEENA